jgi:hypothetical protein
LNSFKVPPEEIILDFGATDDPANGNQEKNYFNGFYDGYCFLPLYVFCGDQLLVSYLRPSRVGAIRTMPSMSSGLQKTVCCKGKLPVK